MAEWVSLAAGLAKGMILAAYIFIGAWIFSRYGWGGVWLAAVTVVALLAKLSITG